ncbi:MAG: hypothetical protein VB013_14655 [Anaerolineaceae bacterium]|nr:hypothetical protein [Anaerolineaceae bacterium]
MNFMAPLSLAFKRLPQLLRHPRRYFSETAPAFMDGLLVIFALFLATLVQKLLLVKTGASLSIYLWALEEAAVNSLLVWSIFMALFSFVLAFTRQPINYASLAGQVGAAGIPLVVTTLISAVLGLIALLAPSISQRVFWAPLHTLLAWVGLVLSWPGLFGYFLLREAYKMKQLWAVLIPGAALIVMLLASVLPLFL